MYIVSIAYVKSKFRSCFWLQRTGSQLLIHPIRVELNLGVFVFLLLPTFKQYYYSIIDDSQLVGHAVNFFVLFCILAILLGLSCFCYAVEKGIKVERVYCGTFVTSLEMPGVSLTLLKVK